MKKTNNQKQIEAKIKHGDTLIEVLLAMSVFAVVLVSGVQIMNSGLNEAQRSLEITMARAEIDAQAEAIRYIHNSYASEREYDEKNRQYSTLWEKIVDEMAFDNNTDFSGTKYIMNNANTCEEAYNAQVLGIDDSSTHRVRANAFVLNTRFLIPRPSDVNDVEYKNSIAKYALIEGGTGTSIKTASLYPRLVFKEFINDKEKGEGTYDKNKTTDNDNIKESVLYRQLSAAEGIWMYAVKGETSTVGLKTEPQYYDFYIRTCWNASGQKTFTTLNTIVRLYNPGVVD